MQQRSLSEPRNGSSSCREVRGLVVVSSPPNHVCGMIRAAICMRPRHLSGISSISIIDGSLWSYASRALCTAPTTPPGSRPTPVFHKFVGKKAAKRAVTVATQGQSPVSTNSAESGANSAGSGAVPSPLQPAATQATPVKTPASAQPVQPPQAPAPKPPHKAPTTSGSAQAVVAPPALRLTTIPRNRTNTLQPSTILPLAPAHIYKKSATSTVQIAPAAPPLQKPRSASQRGKAGTPPPVAPLFPSLADASEFSKMKEQFAKIRAEREARGLLQSGSSSQDRGQYTQRPLSPSSPSSVESVSGTPSPKSVSERITAIRRSSARAKPIAAPVRNRTGSPHRQPSGPATHNSSAFKASGAGTAARKAAMFAKRKAKSRRARSTSAPNREVELHEGITPRVLAERMGVQLQYISEVLKDLGENEVSADSSIDVDVAEVIVTEAGQTARRTDTKRRDRVRTEVDSPEDATARGIKLVPRFPVFTLLGHVDHGKTTLLDTLRGSNVAAKEVGGITQCVAGFMTAFDGKPVTFMDTPGHALFQSMRERGASAADVAVLVVAAEDGVMPQTVSAVKTIIEFSLPCVVAITKADILPDPEARRGAISQQLLEAGLVTEEFGGDVPMVVMSSKTGYGMEAFKEALLLQAEILEPTAAVDAPGEAIVVESTTVKGLGNVADCVVRWGMLKQGDYFVVGNTYGRVRALLDSKGARIKEAAPSTPVRVVGISDFPKAGQDLLVVPNEDAAKGVIEGRTRRDVFRTMLQNTGEEGKKRDEARKVRMAAKERERRLSLAQYRDRLRRRKIADGLPIPDDLKEQEWERLIARGDDPFSVAERKAKAAASVPETPPVNLVILADTQGSIDAIRSIVEHIPQEDVKVRVVRSAVGDISSGDVDMAVGAKAILIAFNIKIAGAHAKQLKHNNITTLVSSNVYGMLDMISAKLSEFMPESLEEEVLGVAEVKQLFPGPRGLDGAVVGAIVTSGEFQRVAKFRLVRDGRVLWEGDSLQSMRRFSDDVNKVVKGLEFGLGVPHADTRQGDKIVSYTTRAVKKPMKISL